MDDTGHLKSLYKDATGLECVKMHAINGSGSNRRYFRMTNERDSCSVIGVIGTDIKENNAFIYLDEHFSTVGLPVPKIIAIDKDKLIYLQEDLGDISLFSLLPENRYYGNLSSELHDLLYKTIKLLPHFQFRGAEGLDYRRCYPVAEFNRRSILWDLNYFKYYFLKLSGIEFDENLLEENFNEFADILLSEEFNTFMYRDFQSRNVFIKDNQPYFIDFQGGRKGPVYYDLASFLWQASANYPDDLRKQLIGCYLGEASKYHSFNKDKFNSRLIYFILFRILQVLGAYGFRGIIERKSHFLKSIPPALENLQNILNVPLNGLTYLQDLLHSLLVTQNTAQIGSSELLTVTINSFSYKKGLPVDHSGNGGGYVFDCRAIDNPGRYEAYKTLTGRDAPVKEFLEKEPAMAEFLTNVSALVDRTIKNYISRGFKSLMVSFGCTGGQHRSVYAADCLAQHIKKNFKIRIALEHREQNIKELL